MKHLKIIAVVLPILFWAGCQKESVEVHEPDAEPRAVNAMFNENSYNQVYSSNRDGQDPLNVVYFIPTDFVAAFDKNKTPQKISEVMLFSQAWYKKQMELNGYPDKTFALNIHKNKKWIGVIPVYGTKTAAEYANNGEVKAEIETYFTENPQLKKSEHTMVFSDFGTGFANNANGRMAFCRSSDNFNVVSTGQFLDELELLHWGTAGGCIHELGHALNSPHMAHRSSENPNRSMMGGGGANRYNSGNDLNTVRLTPASAAIFDVSAAFNRADNGIDYYELDPTIIFKSYTIEKVDAEELTRAAFTFTSNVVPKHLYVAMDARPSNVNNDYDKVTFTTTVSPTGNPDEYYAEVDMPYADFFNGYQDAIKTDNNIELSVHVLTENGFRKVPLSYNFTIDSATSPTPNNNINKELFEFSNRSSWTVTANSYSNRNNDEAFNPLKVRDADYSTFWYSDWPYRFAESGPHIIDVDMGESKTFEGIYTHSQNSNNAQFRIKHVLIEISQDGQNYTEVLDYFSDSIDRVELKMLFDEAVTARYFRLTVDEIYKSFPNHADNLIINELDILTP